MANVDVGVLIPVYNQASLVLGALDSVARQSAMPQRLVVVDDGSKDGTADAVIDWLRTARPDCETLLLRQPRNRGLQAALNRGLAKVRDCRYVAALDADDLWPADFIQRAYGALAARPEAVAATCDQFHVFDGSDETQLFDARAIEPNAASWLFATGVGIVSATMLKLQPILDLGGINERLRTGHDVELLLSLSLLGPWLHLPGNPAVIRRPSRHNGGAPTHLSEMYSDNQRQWARIHDDFIVCKGGNRVVPRRLYSRTLANRWSRAGQQLLRAGRVDEARQCLLRSLAWRPWRSSVWSQWLNGSRQKLTNAPRLRSLPSEIAQARAAVE